ncbi:hypothetical protein RCH23_003386 [Cryobacterium sp. CAN_C3]|uniref:hypothetical protein n=1 Tax=unclassified Cryobacterium TaxID=2649013 RepID=UPI0018CB5F64|nr:hypothetical protein [Cryobacterium sp. CAN_C3]MEC5155983.1 hypothetical protein [Cryobacterium sp. CAN_C3]
MSENTALYQRIKRRETHSSRSGLAITLAVIVILASAYAITEMILHLAGQPALVSDMFGVAQATAGLAEYTAGIVIAVGIVTALIGLINVTASLTAGRRARHLVETEKTSAVVDNAVIASGLARHAASAGNISPDNVTVSVSHRSAVVRLTPAIGAAIDTSAVTAAVQEQLDSYALIPKVRPRVVIDEHRNGGS